MTDDRQAQPGDSGFRYPNAPIAEAVWDVRVAWSSPPAPSELESLPIRDEYPICKTHVALEAQVHATAEDVTTGARRRLAGYRFESVERGEIVLARPDGLSFSRLAPYQSWSEFSREAFRVWDIYREQVGRPGVVQRIAVRYINQIVPPPGGIDISAYLRTRPEISDDMPIMTSGYFLNLEIPLVQHEATLRLVQTIVDLDAGRALVLDIDVFQEIEEPVRSDLHERFEVLRDAKNMVFEASITEESRRLFQ